MGAQITLHTPVADDDLKGQDELAKLIYNEMNYAPVGFDTFYALQKEQIENSTNDHVPVCYT